jgi:hypothetical protein
VVPYRPRTSGTLSGANAWYPIARERVVPIRRERVVYYRPRDDSHYGPDFEQIAKLYDHASESYVWAHDLVTLHYSDDDTDYPLLFQLWQPVDLAKLEQGLRTAQVPLKASKEPLKETAPHKWRSYLLGVWQRRQKQYPELRNLYDSKLSIAQALLQQWVTAHPDEALPVVFDNWFTQPDFCRFLDDTLHLPYVGTLADSDKVTLKTGQKTLQEFADQLKKEHLEALAHGGKPVFQRITIAFKGKSETYYSYLFSATLSKGFAQNGLLDLIFEHYVVSTNRLNTQHKARCVILVGLGRVILSQTAMSTGKRADGPWAPRPELFKMFVDSTKTAD